jgi:hypothetical protein
MKALDYRPAEPRPMSGAGIGPRPKAIGAIKWWLEVLIDAAAREEIPAAAKNVTGPGKKAYAHEIATEADKDYWSLTGRAPTRSNYKDKSFVEFLQAILAALGLPDSADSLAKRVIEQRHKDHAEKVVVEE